MHEHLQSLKFYKGLGERYFKNLYTAAEQLFTEFCGYLQTQPAAAEVRCSRNITIFMSIKQYNDTWKKCRIYISSPSLKEGPPDTF